MDAVGGVGFQPPPRISRIPPQPEKAGNNNTTGRGSARWAPPKAAPLLFPAFSGYGGLREILGGALGSHVPHCSQLQWPPRSWGNKVGGMGKVGGCMIPPPYATH